jgi:hypothetical protein
VAPATLFLVACSHMGAGTTTGEGSGIVRTIRLGPVAAIAAGGGNAYAVRSGQLVEIDGSIGKALARARVGAAPAGVAVGFGAIWVANSRGDLSRRYRGQDTVSRYDLRTHRTQTIAVPAPEDVAAGGGSVWILGSTGGRVYRIDPVTRRVVATVSLPGGPPADLAAGSSGAWVNSRLGRGDRSLIARVDRKGLRIDATIRPRRLTASISVSGSDVWATYFGTILRIDPRTNRVTDTFKVPNATFTAAGPNAAWANGPSGAVTRLTESGPGKVIRIGRPVESIAVDQALLWVLDAGGRLLEIQVG